MKKILLAIACIVSAATQTQAQTLIHYWDFNNFSGTYHIPNVPSLKADYSIIDTNKTALVYQLIPGTSSTYKGYIDGYTTIVADSDIYNLRTINGSTVAAGNAYRLRNPSDSAMLLFYMPSTKYTNLTFSYTVEASSTTSGIHTNNFSYSTDSGATWKTVGLDHTSDSTISIGGYTATQCVFKLVTVKFTSADTTVNNNPKLVFRIIPSATPPLGTTIGTSGNDRFDNFALDGTAITTGGGTGGGGTSPGLVHYWNFNNFVSAFHNPGIPALKADYSVLDTNITSLNYTLLPGTSSTYAGYIDFYTTALTDLDTNNRTINGVPTPSGNSYRFRNPSDSASLVFYIPSINYKNLVFSYAVMASSFTSGMLKNYYYYSLDSGATWLTSGLSEAFDTTTLTFSLKTIQITDPLAYNNPKLAFKIVPQGNTAGTSGNDRFDNVTLDGIAIDTSYHYHSHVAVPNIVNNTAAPVLYPNPAGNIVNINTFAEGDKAIAIYNTTGQRVYSAISSDKIVNINTAQLTPGLFYVNLRMLDGSFYTMKFIKQ